jgi:endo-1,4-beta-xylanase
VRAGFETYWDQITPENEGKWGSVQPSSMTSFNWTSLDRTYAFAQSNKIVFKQHTFVWRDQQPGWVNAGNAGAAVKNWMQSFCARYPDTRMIDVVNEAYHKTPSYIAGMGGAGTTGWDWIVNAFKWARAACPNAILILNDYNNIEYDADSKGFIDLVNTIVAAGAPVDAVGAQGHDAYKLPTATVKKYLDALAATGLPVYITEYDIDEADDTTQKTTMQDQFTMFWNHPSVAGITLWGYIVGQTWEPNTGLQQANGTMRPAMTWLMSFLAR